MRELRWTALALAGAGGMAACLVTGPPLQQRLIGVDARELRNCVGVPTNIDISEDREILVFRFGATSTTLLDTPANSRGAENFPGTLGRRRQDPGGFCELKFALRDGRVEEVEVRARRANGLNDNAACLRRAGSCAPPIEGETDPR